MGQLRRSLVFLSRLMYRHFSLFISCTHLYITNILRTLICFCCMTIVIASALLSLIFIYLSSDLFLLRWYCYCFRIVIFDIYLSALWCIYCFVILHFVSEWYKPPCRGFDSGSMCWNSTFKFIISLTFPTRRYSIEAFIRMVAPHQPYSSSWSTTFLVNGLGQGEYRGGALQLVSEPYSEQM